MAQPYPISRESREEAEFFGDGSASYGPFDLKIFDVADVDVWLRADDAAVWTEAAPTVTKTSGLAFDTFSIAFPYTVPVTTKIKVLSARVPERSAGVTNGTKIDPNALEKELTKLATVQQELRRDVGRGIQVQFGDGYAMADDLEDGDTLMKSGSRLVKGANAADITLAQGYAESAAEDAAAALDAKGLAEEAAATVIELLEGVPGFSALWASIVGLTTTAASWLQLKVLGYVATRTLLKALPVAAGQVVKLTEAGREGVFIIRVGTQPLADPNEGVFIDLDAADLYAERLHHDMKFDVRWFGAKLDNSTNDTTAFQAAIDFASIISTNPYAPRAEVFCPSGFMFKTTSQLNLYTPIKLNIRSPLVYHNTTGIALFFHENAPANQNNYWDVDLEAVFSAIGVGGFPAGPNVSGNIGISIRSMTFSRFKCWQIQGFSYKAVELDGRGISYGLPGGIGQVIQHNEFHFGQIVNNAIGIWAFSIDAATSSVQGNCFYIQNIYQNWTNIITGDATYHATTSNTWHINAMDNCTAVGIDSFGLYEKYYIGFAGTPGTTLRRNPQSDYNDYEFNNNYSTDIVVNEAGGGKHDTLRCKPPNNLPATGVGVVSGVDNVNSYGCPIIVYVPTSGSGTYQVILRSQDGTSYSMPSAFGAAGLVTIHVKAGWSWKLFTSGGSISYGAATILPA